MPAARRPIGTRKTPDEACAASAAMLGRLDVMAAAMLATSTTAAIIDVNWVIPMDPQTLTVAPGDQVRFQWGGRHNVYEVRACLPDTLCAVATFADHTGSLLAVGKPGGLRSVRAHRRYHARRYFGQHLHDSGPDDGNGHEILHL